MNKLSWAVALLSVVWFGVCWQWYVCGVKDQCGVQVVEVTKEVIKVVEVTKSAPATTTPMTTSTPQPATSTAPVTPAACDDYLTGYVEYGVDNNPDDVWKVKQFLRKYEGASIVDQRGVYDFVTFEAVKDFQLKYQDDILLGQSLSEPTGYVYTATQRKINELYCAAQTN